MNCLTLIQFTYDPFTVPLGSLYLAYGLEKANIQFDLKLYPSYNKQGFNVDIDRLCSFLIKSNRIIAIGCLSDKLPILLAALEKVKKKFPEKIIILGGIGPTEVAEEIINKFDFIDFVIKGCGILPLPVLIKKIIRGEKVFTDVDGLVYRNGKNIKSNGYNSFYLKSVIPENIPYHRLKNIGSYDKFFIFTSFGCPYKCTYCQIPCLSKKGVLYKDINKVIEEITLIKKIKKNGKLTIFIKDEAFIINRERVIKFCNLLKAKKLNVRWRCYGRVDRIDRELLEIMSKSGCESIFFGVESGSNKILKKIKKGFTVEKVIEMLLLSKQYIKQIIASFIFLYPFETIEDFRKTLYLKAYLESQKIETQLNQLTPIKNSELYLEYKKNLNLFYKKRSTFHLSLDDIPKECTRLIKNNPDIFYFYYLYNFKDLNKILKLEKASNRKIK